MRALLIVWHSSTGAAQQMAEAAATQHVDKVTIHLRKADTATTADVLAADGLIFVAPEMLGSMAGAMKSFFERCYYPVLGQVNGRPYATMIAAGSDGAGALRDIRRIAAGWRLREVIPPLIIRTHAQTAAAIAAPKVLTEADRRRCADLGATFAEGLALGIF